jgi:regulator of RNase E activity RraA
MSVEISLKSSIIEYIQTNRVSTTEFADAMGKTGSLPGLMPLTDRHYRVGVIRHIQVFGGSNYELHKQLERCVPGEIIFIEPIDFGHEAVFGDLVAKFALLYQGVAAIVVNGNVRDLTRLKKEAYPIWALGSNPVGAINTEVRTESKINLMYDGGIAVCDDGGVVLCPPNSINKTLFRAIKAIELQEDIWYYCLNTLKWSTFEIICNKRYLSEPDSIPRHFIDALELD